MNYIRKIIINENQRGLLFRNGTYQNTLVPGKYRIKSFLGETCVKMDVSHPVDTSQVNLTVLMKDTLFAENTSYVDVPDGYIALHLKDGHIITALYAGTYCFWNAGHRHEFQLINISNAEITDLTREQLMAVPHSMYTKIEVAEGESCLLFIDGKLERMLNSGSYYFWKNMQKITYQTVDLRTQQLDIAGQEILTADKVSLRLNFTCSYRITDALKLVSQIKDYKAQIYTLTQLALREYVGRFRFDELLEQKESIAAFVLKQLQTRQDSLYVEFSDAGLKDIILPGEIRDIMNTVLIAEKNAQANVIARREEVASTRSLLNTAKLMDENTTLYKLKELEYMEKICDSVGSISVGGGNLISELREILG